MEKVTVSISKEVYEKLKSELTEDNFTEITSYKDLIGKKLFIRTVTYHFIGKVVNIFGEFLQLEGASWIADSGRFSNCIEKGSLNEVEPLGNWNVNISTITDFGEWKHSLPVDQK